MNKVTCRDGNRVFRRVSKAAARKAWKGNQAVTFCPAKLYPFGGWRPSITVNPQDTERKPFDDVVRGFEYYNCQLHETGYYAAFYVEVVA